MTINPRDYDLDELRKMARRPEDGLDGDRDPAEITVETDEDVLAGESFRSGLHRELLPFLDDDLEKPYLSALPETYAAEFVVFEWLEFLLMHSGHRGAEGALAYYESVDWITDDVRDGLSEYLRGIDDAGAGAGDGSDLDVDDHMLSLVYVAKLNAMA